MLRAVVTLVTFISSYGLTCDALYYIGPIKSLLESNTINNLLYAELGIRPPALNTNNRG